MAVSFQAKVAGLAARFAAGLPDRFVAIDRLAAHLRAGGAPDGAPMAGDREAPLLELRRRLHEIAGVAGTFGFPALGRAARDLERPLAEALHATPAGAPLPAEVLADPRGVLEAALAADRAASAR